MTRFFNTTGPIDPADHYAIDPFTRINWPEIEQLIRAKRYFILHAPRQTGKTTLLEAVVRRLNAEGRYEAMRISVSSARGTRSDFVMGNRLIVRELLLTAPEALPQSWLAVHGRAAVAQMEPGNSWRETLTEWTRHETGRASHRRDRYPLE